MDKHLEMYLRSVFPAGNDWERNDSQLDTNDYMSRIKKVLDKYCDTLPLDVAYERWSGSQCDKLVFTDAAFPDFGSWRWMDNQEKQQWYKENRTVYVAMWVKVSRVADFYITYFNHWHPSENTGNMVPDCELELDEKWQGYSEDVFRCFHEQGFLLASRDFLNEKVPFVLTWGGNEIPKDDPRWEDDDFEPDPVPAVIYDCLFGDE